MKSTDRRELLRSAWVLPSDVKVLPAEDLSERVRQGIEARLGEFAVTRPGFRTFSRIVAGDTIALLDEFRTPKPLAQGVVSFARGRGLDPETALRDAFPMLQTFAASFLLVPGDSDFVDGIEASFVAGQIAFGFEIKRLVQVLHDTEVYLGETPDGRAVALKIARSASSETTRPMLAREAAILERLGGVGSPRLLKAALAIETPYLVMDWVHGVPIGARAAELRIAAHPGWRTRLHGLCADLIDTYARLHARNVVHADVHPQHPHRCGRSHFRAGLRPGPDSRSRIAARSCAARGIQLEHRAGGGRIVRCFRVRRCSVDGGRAVFDRVCRLHTHLRRTLLGCGADPR